MPRKRKIKTLMQMQQEGQKQTKNYKCHLTIGYYSAISIVQLFYKVCYFLNIIHNNFFNFIRLLKRLTILVRFQTVNVIIYLILD